MSQHTFERYQSDYAAKLQKCLIQPQWVGAFERAAAYAIKHRKRYQAVEKLTGVPWALVAAWHWREASGSFTGAMHNGDKIIGTNRLTYRVPKGRGPFATWQDSAVDAMRIKNLQNVKDWSLERICYESERYNGFGYRQFGLPSPYLWAGSNIYKGGKYTKDHEFDPSEWDKQIGCIPLFMRITALAPQEEIISTSKVLTLGRRVRMGLKAVLGTIGGLLTLDTAGIAKEWLDLTAGAFKPQVLIPLAIIAVAAWALLNWNETALVREQRQKDEADAPDPE